MEAVLIIAGLTFLVCWLIDKGFAKLFRSRPQQKSGKAVHLSKFYSLGGLFFTVLGIFAIITGISASVLLAVGGGVTAATGIFLIVYFLSFGIYYDEESFLVTSLGKKSETYRCEDIQNQQLYNNRGRTLIELHMKDGRAVQLQDSMTNTYSFMDTAFAGWCAQRNIRKEDCSFHDPANSCWFPPVEVS